MEYYKDDHGFEHMLSRMNAVLSGEFGFDRASEETRLTGQIVGLPRSGTTILYQLLARTGLVGYPSNVMAYFWSAPQVGARLQERLARNGPTLSLSSLAGRTSEPLDPHEFGLFWRDALGHSKNSMLADGVTANPRDLRSVLDLINDAFAAPTVFKNFLAPAHADFLSEEVGRQKFFLVRRDPLEVAASIFSMRRRLNIELSDWFGPSPVDSRLEYNSVHEMIAHQVASLRSTVDRPSFSESSHTLVLELPDLVREPREAVLRILTCLDVDVDQAVVAGTVPCELNPAVPYSGLHKSDLNKLESELSEHI